MSLWHLVWIIPLFMAAGAVTAYVAFVIWAESHWPRH